MGMKLSIFLSSAHITVPSSDRISRTKFVNCDATNWEDQLKMFRTAADFSADGRISYVVANAGIARADDVFSYSGKLPKTSQHTIRLHTERLLR